RIGGDEDWRGANDWLPEGKVDAETWRRDSNADAGTYVLRLGLSGHRNKSGRDDQAERRVNEEAGHLLSPKKFRESRPRVCFFHPNNDEPRITCAKDNVYCAAHADSRITVKRASACVFGPFSASIGKSLAPRPLRQIDQKCPQTFDEHVHQLAPLLC